MIHEEENKKQSSRAEDAQRSQQLNTPSTDKSIVPAAGTIPEAEQSQTTNYKPATEEMEVHHHPHPAHGKKNWKEYFWEFHDVSIQQDLAYCITQIKGSNIILTTRLKLLKEKATHTIEFLQKEYHLN